MPKLNDIHSIIIPAQNANLSAHTYTEVYGGGSGCTININGVTINVGASSSFNLRINSVSGGTGCFLLGEKQDVYQGSNIIGGIA
jgi:hypothetical protein